ncbi:MAG: hypothetical protein H0T73_17375 [Ardenticatenales bacterium]|nr:hypothetical protein [Ardenticatenales bacterium]
MQPTVYDSAWVARLSHEDGTAAYPHLLPWLLAQQHDDGSWGGQLPYLHDRFLSTLTVLLLLAHPSQRFNYWIPIRAGETYLREHVTELDQDLERTAGFELILPSLLVEARQVGLALPYRTLSRFEAERAAKLKFLPSQGLFTEQTSALFSLEAFAGVMGIGATAALLLENGSMSCSPAATAFLLNAVPQWRSRHPKSVAYLEALMATHSGLLPHFAPYDLFHRGWVLSYLYYAGLLERYPALVEPLHQHLREHWRATGMGFSSVPGALPDADDTAMALLALYRAGDKVEGSNLLVYERAEFFASFPHESHASTSTNLHVLEAIDALPLADQTRVREKIVRFLLQTRREGTFWSDKWHASIYYPTSHALIVLPPYAPTELDSTLQWLLAQQRPNGGWGQYGATVEETALVLLALLYYHRHHCSDPQLFPTAVLHRGARYLHTHEPHGPYPELWIAKVLYAPLPVIQSLILAAVALYEEMFGMSHL